MEYEKNLNIDNSLSRASLTVSVKKEVVKKEYGSLLLKYSKELTLPGFRRGKVPVQVLQSKYSSIIKDDLMSNIIEESLKEIMEALPQEQRPIGGSKPELKEEPHLNLDEDFSFTVVYDVMPKVEILKDEGLEVEVPEIEITDEDIQSELEKIQVRNAIIQEKDDGSQAEKGDIVTVDYKVVDDDSSSMNDYVFTLGSYDSVYMFDDDVLGMKKGEEKEVLKTYGADFEVEALREKEVKLIIKVKAIKGKKLPAIDDDLAQDISEKFKNLSDLKEDIRKNLEAKVASINKMEKDRALIKEFVKANPPINIPESMIQYRFYLHLESTSRQYGISIEKLLKFMGKDSGKMLEDSREGIIAELQEFLLLNALKDKYEVKLSDDEVKTYLNEHKDELGLTEESLKQVMDKPEMKENLVNIAEKDTVLEKLIAKSTFKKGKTLKLKDFIKDEE